MTDEPTKEPTAEQSGNPSDQPPQPPAEPSGVGFAAIHLPGQQPPSQPLPGQAPGYANPYQPPATPQGFQAASPPPPPPGPQGYQPGPPPPPPPGPVYQYDYSRAPKGGGNGASMVIVGVIAFAVVLVAGVGGMFALGIGPFARATAIPTPTLVAHPTPTAGAITPQPSGAVASPLPTPSGSGFVVPSATPNGDPKEALLSHIPAAIAGSCFVSAPEDASAIVALAVCDADGGDIRVTYFQYDDHESMFSAYSGFRLASQIEPDSGDCDDPASWPTENSYNIGDVTAGRLLCTEELSETSLYWTDDRLNILSQATHASGDHERLIDFWRNESGPDL